MQGYNKPMSKIQVKNISEQELAIEGVGIVPAGAMIEVDEDFNNANFEVVGASTATVDAPKSEGRKRHETSKETEND